jgi:misacylated tRNA(Ala) deacylase
VVTDRLYLEDAYLASFPGTVTATRDGWVALDRTAFYPGGGGQPADQGTLTVAGSELAVTEARAEGDGQVWHQVGADVAPGTAVEGAIDWPRRYALMRAHGLMHVVNSIARVRFDGAITGVQLGVGRSRIDLRLDSFGREQLPGLEDAVNTVLARDLPIRAGTITEAEYRARPELVRTLDVAPPVIDRTVRVVEIVGFDAQACGGTHVHTTAEIGAARITRYDNKGRDNKRLYWELA